MSKLFFLFSLSGSPCFHSAKKGHGAQDLYGDGLWSVLSVSDRVGSVRVGGTGWIRPVYFTLLISHIVLAVSSAQVERWLAS